MGQYTCRGPPGLSEGQYGWASAGRSLDVPCMTTRLGPPRPASLLLLVVCVAAWINSPSLSCRFCAQKIARFEIIPFA